MKHVALLVLILTMVFSLSGCGNMQSEEETQNPLLDKIYMNNSPFQQKSLDFDFLKFYNDNTFQGLDANYQSYYGTYTIDGSALTLNLSDKTYAGVILDDGADVTFGTDEFTDWTSHIKDTDPIFEKFK